MKGHAPAGSAANTLGMLMLVAASYLLAFAFLARNWLVDAAVAVPTAGPASTREDARLIAFQLAWVSKALREAPARVLDAPIFHPAPCMLTGTEGFFGSQAVFAPVFLATGNAVLALSWATFLTYPLAALCLFAFCLDLGFAPLAAWCAGLSFALGPLRVPANVQVLQYPDFLLPLAALASRRLASRTSVAGILALAAVLVGGVLASFYLALILLVSTAIWSGIETIGLEKSRSRHLVAVGAACTMALVVLAVVGQPWSTRQVQEGIAPLVDRPVPAGSPGAGVEDGIRTLLAAMQMGLHVLGVGVIPWVAALFGAGEVRNRERSIRLAAVGGATLFVAGFVLALGPSIRLGGWILPLPFAAIANSPARFFRRPWRFVVLAGFGLAILQGVGLDRFSRRSKSVALIVAMVFALGVLWNAEGKFVHGPLDRIGGAPRAIDEALKRAALDGRRGSLLELPLFDPESPDSRGRTWIPDAMLRVLDHGVPLVTGFTGFPPPHDLLVRRFTDRFLRGGPVDELVDMTHLRWIILRPVEDWARPEERVGIRARPDLALTSSSEGWDLLEVLREPRHAEWFEAISEGKKQYRSSLGTPFAAVEGPRGAVTARVDPDTAKVGSVVILTVDLRNDGVSAWPAGQPGVEGEGVMVGFRTSTSPGTATPMRYANLWRDVPGGETLAMSIPFALPEIPGRHTVDVGLSWGTGSAFASTEVHVEATP